MNSNKYIFLDIDGVISLDFDEYFFSNKKKWHPKMNHHNFNIKAVKILNEICTLCNPIIILSSDWKLHYSIDEMNEFFEWNGITYKINDYTISYWGEKYKSLDDLEECRATEILAYVNEHEITNYVAIDDLDLSSWIPKNFVLTPRSNEGIKQCGVKNKIINILK